MSCSQGGFFACAGGRVCTDGLCVEPAAVGADCTGADDCGLSAYCDFNDDQTCAPPKSLGESCSGTLFGECGGYLCTDGTCALRSTDPPKVRETKEFVGDGADCSDANGGPGLVCWPNADVSQHRCQPKFKRGESCEPETEIARFDVLLSIAGVTSCETGLCDITSESWTCVDPAAPGESCSRPGTLSLECLSAICGGNGECAERFPDECP